MRVSFDVSSALTAKTGIGHYAFSLFQHLTQIPSIEVSPYALTVRSADTESFPGLRRWPLPGRLGPALWSRLSFPKGELLTGSSDLIHGTNFWVPPLKTRRGIVSIHDLTFLFYPEFCTGPVRDYAKTVPKVLESCVAVITPTETIKREVVKELGFPEERIFVTYEGIRGDFFEAKPSEEIRRKLGLERPYLLFAGNREPRKNLERLLKAFAQVRSRDLVLVLVGLPGWGAVDLEPVVRSLDLEGRLVFTGYLTDEDLAATMATSEAVVYPSIYEGFGLPALEACATGVPVVAGRVGSLPEVLEDIPLWCNPFEVNSIAEAIENALARNRTDDLPSRARSLAAKFTWERTADLTVLAYQKSIQLSAQG